MVSVNGVVFIQRQAQTRPAPQVPISDGQETQNVPAEPTSAASGKKDDRKTGKGTAKAVKATKAPVLQPAATRAVLFFTATSDKLPLIAAALDPLDCLAFIPTTAVARAALGVASELVAADPPARDSWARVQSGARPATAQEPEAHVIVLACGHDRDVLKAASNDNFKKLVWMIFQKKKLMCAFIMFLFRNNFFCPFKFIQEKQMSELRGISNGIFSMEQLFLTLFVKRAGSANGKRGGRHLQELDSTLEAKERYGTEIREILLFICIFRKDDDY